MKSVYKSKLLQDEASSSVLTLLPHKNTDGAGYRCTVWNRALGQHQKLETRTSLAVNCEYQNIRLMHQNVVKTFQLIKFGEESLR